MSEVSVSEAADLLGVDASRVRQLIDQGTLPARRVGHMWLVPDHAVHDLRSHPHRAGRPMAPGRAWGLLDLLDGGEADWLSPVARSQVRAAARRMAGADPDRWRDALRGREDRLLLRAHPAAIPRLRSTPGVWPAGPEAAEDAGIDLVAIGAVPEFYVPPGDWEEIARGLHLLTVVEEPAVILRLPRGPWPWEGGGGPGPAVLSASLLDGREWRATEAAAWRLNEMVDRLLA